MVSLIVWDYRHLHTGLLCFMQEVLPVTTSCTQCYADSDEIAIIRGEKSVHRDAQQVHVIGLNHLFRS